MGVYNADMKIEKVEAIPFSIPLKHEVRWGAAGRKTAQEHVLIRVYTESGVVGVAEATPRPTIYGDTQASVVSIVEQFFAPMLVGRNVMDREGYWALLDTIPWNPTAKGGLDIAIHDAIAQTLGVPLAELLGGTVRPVKISYQAGLGTADSLLAEAAAVAERTGILAFKIKIGEDPKEDILRVRRMREHFGEDAFLFADANQLYTPEVAIRTINAMAEYGLAMIEEPVPIHLDGPRKRVAEAIPVPILSDDSVVDLVAVRRELQTGAIGVVGIKPPRTGVYNSVKILHLAEAHGLPCWIGSQGVSGVGTLASAHIAAAFKNIPFPADLGNFLKQHDDLLEDPDIVKDGAVQLSSQPGIGAQISEEKLNRFRIDK